MEENEKLNEWNDAVLILKVYNDNTALVNVLRKIHDHEPYGIPDLSFLADLLEGKFAKSKGRPKEFKIVTGLKQTHAKETVSSLMSKDNLSLEEALVKASDILLMSESKIKKLIYRNKKT